MDRDRPLLFIDGQWAAPKGVEEFEVLEAATERLIGRAGLASPADVDDAVAAARGALRGPWGTMTREERVDALSRFAVALRARGRDTARLVSQENGMPITLSKVVNGVFPAMAIDYYAKLLSDLTVEEVRPGLVGQTVVRREPAGVVAAITPWNYPQSLAVIKLAPALAAGCTVVLKPSPETAFDAYAFAEAAEESGLPPGVLNVVPGGRATGQYLVAHPDVNKVAFTGSTDAGRAIGETCGRLLRPVTLELGGKSAAILADDADLDLFASNIADVCLANSGQTCHVSSRILAPRSRYADVVDVVTSAVKQLAVGDPLDAATRIGPMVSKAHRARVLDYIDIGRSEGGRLTTGGGVPDGRDQGWFVEPTVFADVTNGDRIAREEIFGPVICVIPYDGLDDAIALANDSEYGLAGTVWTSDGVLAMDVARRIETGTVGVNQYSLDLGAPFGGVKASGIGRELGPEGLAPYFRLKSIYTTNR